MTRHFWLVTSLQRFDRMELDGVLPAKIQTAAEPHYYLPVFESRAAAIAWNNGSESGVHEMRQTHPQES